MQRFLLLSLLLAPGSLLASPAAAAPVDLWSGIVETSTVAFPQTFRLAASESAYVELTASVSGQSLTARPSDGGATAALFAALTNGVNDPLTWSNGAWSHTVAENHLFPGVVTASPVQGGSGYPDLVAGRTDLAGFALDRLVLSVRNSIGGQMDAQFRATLYGAAPEPTSAVLLMFGLVALAHGVRSPRD